MNERLSMSEVALIIKGFDTELRQALQSSRSGLFRKVTGELYVRRNIPLGQTYQEEVIGIFADSVDLDFYYKLYLNE